MKNLAETVKKILPAKAPAVPLAPRLFKKPSPIASKTTNNTVKDPRSLVGFRPR